MTRFNVKTMTSRCELVERFVAIALDQDKALFNDEITKFNKLYGQMDAIGNELKSSARGPPVSTSAALYSPQHSSTT